MAPRILAVFAVMALLVSTGTPAAAQVRKALKTLNLVKQVDGPGSGLTRIPSRDSPRSKSKPTSSRRSSRPAAL